MAPARSLTKVVGWRLATALQNLEADTSLTIRKFQSRLFIADDLARIGMLTPCDLETVRHAINSRLHFDQQPDRYRGRRPSSLPWCFSA